MSKNLSKLLLPVWLISCLYCFWLVGFRLNTKAPDNFYGLQTEAFLAGQLPLKMLPNPALVAMPNPYVGSRTLGYAILDLSYYKGRYYSYFGAGPIIYLLIPWRLLTGSYLRDVAATAVLVMGTNLLALLVLAHLRRFFPRVSSWCFVAAYLLLALGSWQTIHLITSNPGTISQASGYLGITGAMLCLLLAMERKSAGWVAGVSACCGVVLASKPSMAPCVALLLPVLTDPRLRRWSTLAAAVVPLALITSALLAYNHARFDSYLEFGNRLQLVDEDHRFIRMFGADFLGQHWRQFLFAAPTFLHFFPFLDHHAGPGLLWACPAVLLALGALALPGRRSDRDLVNFGAACLILFLGNFALLAAFKFFFYHYSVDFIVPAAWCGVLGWLILLNRLAAVPVWRRAAQVTGGCLILVAVLFAGCYTLGDGPPVGRLSSVANRVVAGVDSLRGVSFGGLVLRGRLDRFAVGESYPLVSAALHSSDVAFLRILPAGFAQVGVIQAGVGPTSVPFVFDPAVPHTYEIEMGALLPPASHPYFDGWDPEEIGQAARLVRVVVDGSVVLLEHGGSSGSDGGAFRLGADPGNHAALQRAFPGKLTSSPATLTRSDWAGVLFPRLENVRLQFSFQIDPQRETTTNEPLVSLGQGKGALVLYLRNLGDGRYRLGMDRINFGAVESTAFELDAHLPHTVVVWSDADAAQGILVGIDGTRLIHAQQPAFPIGPRQVFYGVNAMGSSVAFPAFEGAVFGMSPLAAAPTNLVAPAGAGPIRGFGAVSFTAELSRTARAAGQPLLSAGVAGRADVVYQRLTKDGKIVIGLDHWGVGADESRPIAADPFAPHRWVIELGEMRSATAHPATQPSGVTVRMDGRVVFATTSRLYPVAFQEVTVGGNPMEASSAVGLFEGEISSVKVLP